MHFKPGQVGNFQGFPEQGADIVQVGEQRVRVFIALPAMRLIATETEPVELGSEYYFRDTSGPNLFPMAK